MQYSIPEKMPSRQHFIKEFLEAIFPDLEAMNCTKTGYGYSVACERAARETGLLNSNLEEYELKEDSNLFRLLFEMAQNSETIFNKTPSLLADNAYKQYAYTLSKFTSDECGNIKNWLKEPGSDKTVRISFEAALFFSFLLLSRKACLSQRKPFFEKCLEYVGITDIEGAVSYKLFDYDWDEIEKKEPLNEEHGDNAFSRLNNNAIILFGTVALTIFEMLGSYSAKKDQAKLKKLYSLFTQTFEKEIQASNAMEKAERALFNNLRVFHPRSIQTKDLNLQDFFVFPVFEHNKKIGAKPLSEINSATKSNRLLIVAKTGMGKSVFLHMATMCMLSERYGTGDYGPSSLKSFSETIDAPKDMFVISVPASMFSFCYKNERYHEWTTDFVTLFLNCMWKLPEGRDFYSTQGSQRSIVNQEPSQTEEETITEELTAYVQELARTGKLLLLLDSFDEISSGEMRAAYLKTLTDFYDRYCCYPEANEVGAHVIVSSREMSPNTMAALETRLELEANANRYGICPLNKEQREELILKWNRFKRDISGEESRGIIQQIENNHFYQDYSVNPYMLSVVCFYFGRDLGSITQDYITTLVDRMLKNNRNADLVIQDVLYNIVKILQDIAGETVIHDNPHFSRRELEKYLSNMIDKADLLETDIEAYIERLHEIFVTEVGLIVPADGADNDYQFINNQIRFELAAKGFQRALENDDKTVAYREIILPTIKSIEEYVGLLVPLLCAINLENVKLAELLVLDLVMYDFKSDLEEKVLIRAMLDLMLNRYGGNISTVTTTGSTDAKYVRRAQRMLLMRILTSKEFKPTDTEKNLLIHSPAYKSNIDWVSDEVLLQLQ